MTRVPSVALRSLDLSPTQEASFWSMVELNLLGCWAWSGHLTAEDGYGRFKVAGGRRMSANRVAYALAYGEIGEGEWVLHRCDNPRCVRPDHLFLGDAAANKADNVAKGRHAKGERVGSSLLTEAQALAVLGSPLCARDAGRSVGIGKSAAQKIRQGVNWRHLRGLEK